MVDNHSYVVVDRETGKAQFEIQQNFDVLFFINVKNYRIVPILEWLHELNGEKMLTFIAWMYFIPSTFWVFIASWVIISSILDNSIIFNVRILKVAFFTYVPWFIVGVYLFGI